MKEKEYLPFGRWPSPITPHKAGGLLDLSEPAWTLTGNLVWRARGSAETAVLLAGKTGGDQIRLGGALQAGGGLLYGGGSLGVGEDCLVLVDRSSGQLFRISLDGKSSQRLTSTLTHCASPHPSPDSSWAVFIHSDGKEDALCLVDMAGDGAVISLDDSADFYNYPRWHPDGTMLSWMSWDHPAMPWDSSSIWLGTLEAPPGKKPHLSSRERIAGGEGISTIQPEFSPDGKWLSYISDQSGWWQLYLVDLKTRDHIQLTDVAAEHSLPPWLQDRGSYGFSPDSRQIFFLRNQEGVRSLWSMDLELLEENQVALDEDYTWMDWLTVSPAENRIAMVASAPDIQPRLITVSPEGRTTVIQESGQDPLPRDLYSLPSHIFWRGDSRDSVHGLFYPPTNPDWRGEGKPPLLVMVHSGPTRQKFAEFQPRTQYFTSRGYAVLEVNYRGSSGYGREYRQSLAGQWGVADVEDCLSGALYASDQGWVDRDALFLLGSSSGGLTVFQILVRYPGVFVAGVALYPVINHLDLLVDPPKFERYYSDWLIGPYPEEEKLYRERSPVFFADRIRDPVIIFQGGKDPIVPREQTEGLIAKLRENNVPHQYQLYPEEGHGFKRSETMVDFYQKTEDFLRNSLADKGEKR